MKEIPLSHFDVTPEQFQSYIDEIHRAQGMMGATATVDDLVVEEICREVAILNDLDHHNIIKYFTSFSEG
jgi:serine/threonine protein kinase